MSAEIHSGRFGFRELNDFLSRQSDGKLKSFANELDFCRFFSAAPGKKLAVTAKYSPPVDETGEPLYAMLDRKLKPVRGRKSNDYYFGVSPELDAAAIVKAMSELRFSNQNKLDSFIAEHGSWFMLHWARREHLAGLARLVVISMASQFGIRIRTDDEMFVDAVKKAAGRKENPSVFYENGTLTLRGCPTDEILKVLRSNRYRYAEDGWFAVSGETAKSKTIDDIYKEADGGHITLLSDGPFYSGVLLRPVKIVLAGNRMSNEIVSSLVFHFERSTYATVFALDLNRNCSSHPVFSCEAREAIVRMLREDDNCKGVLIEKLSSTHWKEDDWLCDWSPRKLTPPTIEAVNEYLSNSLNVNQICVAADIETADGVGVFGVRDRIAIDAGAFYPGANGNAEVADRRVSHYRFSVGEDFPTIDPADTRIGFEGEIAREIAAELGLPASRKSLRCSGFVLLGNRPPPQEDKWPYPVAKRRMHFTLLFDYASADAFDQIAKRSESAVEKFENGCLQGFVLTCSPDRISRYRDGIVCGLKWIASRKDVVESLLLLSFVVVSFFNLKRAGEKWSSPMNMLQGVLALIVLLVFLQEMLRSLVQKVRSRKRIGLHFYLPQSPGRVLRRIDERFPSQSCHPVAYVCILARLMRLLDSGNEK